MNLVEVWIRDVISIENVEINGVPKIKVTFKTICWGCKDVKTKIFNNIEEWNEFKSKRYYMS